MSTDKDQTKDEAPPNRAAEVRVHDTRQLAIFEPGKTKVFARKLPYRNWTLIMFQARGTLRISIRAKYRNKAYTRLSITIGDLKYMIELLSDIKKELEKAGFELKLI